jgi:hypothetical protein
MSQAQSAHLRLKHASAPPSYDKVPSFSKVHRREGYFASVQMTLVTFTMFFCLQLRQRRVAAGNGLGTGQGTTIKYVRRTASGAAGNGLGTTIKYLRRSRNGTAGSGLGTTINYL